MRFAPQTRVPRRHTYPLLRRSLLSLAASVCMLVLVSDVLGYSVRLFPTHHLVYLVPFQWTTAVSRSGADPTQTWWQIEYGVSIQSPDVILAPPCGFGRCIVGAYPLAQVQIRDYGAGGYTTLQDWYQAWVDGASMVLPHMRETLFAGQPALCAYRDGQRLLANVQLGGVPAEVFAEGCAIRWENRVYLVWAALAGRANQQEERGNLDLLLHILQNLRFL